jgi:pimeloyl-ACP methyl ester carboxylesterase
MNLEDPKQIGSFISVGGLRTFCRSSGSGDPIVLLHGFPTSSYDWRRFLAPLSEFGRAVAPDLYGFGYSDSPKGAEYTITGYLGFLRQFLSTLKIERFTLIGHDWGGTIGLAFALQNPGSISRLVVMDTPVYSDWVAHFKVSPSYVYNRRMAKSGLYGSLVRLLLTRGRVRSLVTPHSKTTLSKEELDQYFFLFKRGMKDPIRLYSDANLKAMEALSAQASAGLGTLRVPALIVWGEEDPFFPPGTPQRLNKDIKGSELHILDGCGHWAFEEKPEQIIELVTSFLHRSPS